MVQLYLYQVMLIGTVIMVRNIGSSVRSVMFVPVNAGRSGAYNYTRTVSVSNM